MKVLTTDQQNELRTLIEEVSNILSDSGVKAQLSYWAIELKPKRVRKKGMVTTENIGHAPAIPVDIEIEVE